MNKFWLSISLVQTYSSKFIEWNLYRLRKLLNCLVKAIRIFIDMSGWIPEYTGSKIEEEYLGFVRPI